MQVEQLQAGEIERIREEASQLLVEQRTVVRSLLRLRAQLAGSLVVRYAECGKEGCACGEGERHGPYFILSNRSRGRGTFSYLSQGQASRARSLVQSRRDFEEGLRRLKTINQALLVLLKRYRVATARRGTQAIEAMA